MHDNVSGIVVAAREQSQALGQISEATMSMDQDTQRNAALVEQTATASRKLATEASALFDLIGQFKVGDERRERVTAPLSEVA